MYSPWFSSCVSRVGLLFAFLFAETLLAQSAIPDFSVVVIPDPQNYSERHPAVFARQTQWIVNNAAALNIRMVIGEGDMVNHDDSATEWANADAAVDILDGKVPYAFAIGNHDYDNRNAAARSATRFNTHFGPLRYASYSWYGGSYNGSNENFFTFFNAGTEQYMVLALEFYPRDAVVTWAHSVLNTYPEKKVIVVTHSFEGSDGMRVDYCDTQDMSPRNGNNANVVWSKLLKQHANVMLVLSGHLIGNGSARRSDLGDNGNLVHQIFTNFQDWTGTREGYLRILKFRPSLNTIEVMTYSPWTNSYMTTSTYQFTLPINHVPGTQTTGSLQGKVRSSTCIRIPGAQVSTAGFTAVTDANGIYMLPGIPAPNGYGVTVTAPYYLSTTTLADVIPGFTTQTNIYLETTVKPSCTLSSTTPCVSICSPAANSTVASPVRVNAGARSSRMLVYMQIYIDGVHRGTFYTAAVDQSYSLTPGTHGITVQAKDSSGVFTKKSISVTISAAPTVIINSPFNNALVGSPVAVRATATAAPGGTIAKMYIYLDGVNVYSTVASSINTSIAASVGTHRLTVQARDSRGAYGKSTIYVAVR